MKTFHRQRRTDDWWGYLSIVAPALFAILVILATVIFMGSFRAFATNRDALAFSMPWLGILGWIAFRNAADLRDPRVWHLSVDDVALEWSTTPGHSRRTEIVRIPLCQVANVEIIESDEGGGPHLRVTTRDGLSHHVPSLLISREDYPDFFAALKRAKNTETVTDTHAHTSSRS